MLKTPKTAFILMKFPVPSETFISQDILSVQSRGGAVKVFTMLNKDPQHEPMVKQRGLESVALDTAKLSDLVTGACLAFIHPILFIKALFWILSQELSRPKVLLKCLILLPRSMVLMKEILQFSPDLVHLSWGHFPSIPAWLIKQKAPNIVFSQFLGAYDLELRLNISKSFSRYADVVWTHARANIDLLKSMGIDGNKINVAYRGISFQLLPENNLQKENTIISVGRLIEAKGFDKLIRIFKKVNDQKPDTRLVILGEGPERKKLEELAASLNLTGKIDFRGHQKQSDVFKAMSEAKIFILPTTHSGERLPNVLKEAMGCRCYCISSESVGIEELLIPGKTGFVIPANDIDAYARLTLNIFNNEEKYGDVLNQAIAHLKASFDREKIVEDYISKWNDLLKKR